jgi:polyhydroxybutyrate depolymerase
VLKDIIQHTLHIEIEIMSKTIKLFALLGALLAGTLACARAGSPVVTLSTTLPASTNLPTSTKLPDLPTGESSHTLAHDGLQRSYLLYAPASIDWNNPVPLVFVFHGGTGNAQSAIAMSDFNGVADRDGFVVIYPNGTGRLSDEKILTWNAGSCCAYAQEHNIDDVGFVRAIVTEMESLANIDTKRIYATGMSNGGMLTQRLACEAADIFAAAAPVSGTLNFPACHPSQPISVIEFHGTDDQNVPYDGGLGADSLVNVDFASVKDSIGFWVTSDGCNPNPQTSTFDDIQHDVWTGCADSTSVELYTIEGGEHAWPGGITLRSTQTISASQLIWEFFTAHPKP